MKYFTQQITEHISFYLSQTQTQTGTILFDINRNQVSDIRFQNNNMVKIKGGLNARYAWWETLIEVRPDRLHRGHPEESTWPGVLTILMTIMSVCQISQIARHIDI